VLHGAPESAVGRCVLCCHPGPRMAGSDPYAAERSLQWQAPKLLVPDLGAEYLGTSFLASASV
jgi:hypothetical protein